MIYTDINKQFLARPRIDIIILLLNPCVTLIVISLIYLLTFDHYVSRKIEIKANMNNRHRAKYIDDDDSDSGLCKH